MVDIHSHILAGLDDGAKTFEASLAMVNLAAKHGTTDIVATPHSNPQFRFDPEVIFAKVRELQTAAGDSIHIHTGCDFHLHYENIQDALANPAKYTINGRGYLLVEFSETVIFTSTENIFSQLQAAGMKLIVTHPERNWLLRSRIDRITEWLKSGVLLQITAQSLLSAFGAEPRRFSEQLMELGLVHLVASDAHDPVGRPPRLDNAFEHVVQRYGQTYAEAIFINNPKSVIEGWPIEPSPLLPEIQPKKRFRFWS